MDVQGAILFFQFIAKRYEKASTIFTSNKTFSQWNEVFADVTIASAIFDRVLHYCTVINIKGESYRLKEHKAYMKQKQQIVNTLFEQNAQQDGNKTYDSIILSGTAETRAKIVVIFIKPRNLLSPLKHPLRCQKNPSKPLYRKRALRGLSILLKMAIIYFAGISS